MVSLDTNDIKIKIEILRNELAKEYEKCVDKGTISTKVIDLSQRLDQLILDYLKMSDTE